jgi:GntR family transcriptional regulator
MTTRTPARYEEIADHLRRVVAGSRPGDRLPSDAELCERFGVSRMTARQAVQTLASKGLLYRTRGQGTFVAPRPVPRVLGSPLSFTESMRSRGMATTSQILDSGTIEPTGEEAKALGLASGEAALMLERLRLADGTPMAIERVVFTPRCAAVLSADLEHGSLHHAFQANGWIPTRAEAEVTARSATSRERRLLQLGKPVVLAERRTISDQDGSPLEHTETVYAAERYVFAAVLHRDATDRLG